MERIEEIIVPLNKPLKKTLDYTKKVRQAIL